MRRLCFFFLFFSLPLIAETSKLSVRGEGTIKRPADQVVLSIGVVTEGQSARDAVDANSKKMERVVAVLKGFGLEKGDMQTGQFQVAPVYTPRPKGAGEDWRPKIAGYQVTNSLQVKTSLIDQIGNILDGTVEAGANSVNDLRFTLKDQKELRNEAIAKATKNALQDAKFLSDAAGLKLERIVSISLDQAEVRPLMKAMAMNGWTSPPFEAGDVELSAGVSVTYEISGV